MGHCLPVSVMIDSGAYTAWKLGREVSLDRYCDFLVANRELIWSYVALDVIPSKPGEAYSWSEYDSAAARSFENYQYMRKRGLDPVPVCHQGERWLWLERYLDAGATYIGLSRRSDFPRHRQVGWLDEAFARLTGTTVRTHGFGITSPGLITRYPWYSYDSATWALAAAAGKIIVPSKRRQGGGFDFLGQPALVTVSGPRERRRNPSSTYEDLTRREQEHVRDYIASGGFTIDDVQLPHARRALNVMYFRWMAAAIEGVHPKFVMVSAPDVNLVELTPFHHHQTYVLLSYDRFRLSPPDSVARLTAYHKNVDRHRLERCRSSATDDNDKGECRDGIRIRCAR
jgi:hypothetical protein